MNHKYLPHQFNKFFTRLFKPLLVFATVCYSSVGVAQQTSAITDSVTKAVHPSYNDVSGVHRWLFGENYRKDWAVPVKMPVLRLSQLHGGLTLVKAGGGMESKSLRLVDPTGTEWVLRSVEKVPDKLLPENLRGTFVVDWVGDEFSGQHPYSALCVPPLAEAAHVPHTNPIIGVVADDPNLGPYRKLFNGMVCLLEEREPTGKSDNTIKFESELIKSYEARFDGREFLRARLLDLLMGDWDRHEDQWRWAVTKDGKERSYVAAPRDRDQVFHITTGLFPTIATASWLDPTLEHFDGKIPRVWWSLYKTRFMKMYPDAQIAYEEWMQISNDFVKAETDSVLEASVKCLPPEIYKFRHDEIFSKLKKRRDNIPAAMSEYYYFINRIADLRTTDKDEEITITDAPKNGTRVVIEKLGKSGKDKGTFMDFTYYPEFTKELRLYTSAGDDHIIIDTKNTPIRLRVIDSTGTKTFDVKQASHKVKVYGPVDSSKYTGNTNRLSRHLSRDSTVKRFVSTNLYNIWAPLANATINRDDGFLLGLGFRYTGHDGFRKLPYSTIQELMVTHSFSTQAFSINYLGQWREAIGKADFVFSFLAEAPDNTTNFFGQGNETILDKTGDYRTFYRARFDVYHFDPALRWRVGKGSTISAGPSFQFYHSNPDYNANRAVSQPGLIKSYDSTTYNTDKSHLGFVVSYLADKRNNIILPTKGYIISVKWQGYVGLNNNSKSFMQVIPSFTWFQKIDSSARLVLSDRIGGGVSLGNPAFYQSMFLGGQGSLLGYLKNRFAGQQMAYNNLQARLRLANIAGYILPGQLGITGFYDVGRVWQNGDHSNIWHQGQGGGIYFSPAALTVVQVIAGHSNEGWYPYIAFNFRL